MASIDRSDPIILGHVLVEHQDLFNRLTAVRRAFADGPPPSPDRLAAVQECLHALRDHLRGHFLQEERGGFLEEAVARMPRLGAAVSVLMAQHPALLAELDGIIAVLPSSLESAAAWNDVGKAYADFAARMSAHERCENAVVQEGYNEDLGLVD
jgi:iron-sulfur cluster repair protein YtfE (RIC family)